MWKTHFNLKYQLEDEDPVHRTVELRRYVKSAWEESETCRWDTEDLWNNNIDVEAALGMGHALPLAQLLRLRIRLCGACFGHVILM